MLYAHDTRRDSRRAKRDHAVAHGLAPEALPLTASIGERLRAKAQQDDHEGDLADELLTRAADSAAA